MNLFFVMNHSMYALSRSIHPRPSRIIIRSDEKSMQCKFLDHLRCFTNSVVCGVALSLQLQILISK